MRIGPDDKIYVITDAQKGDVLEDIISEESIKTLGLRFKGGLLIEENATIFTSKAEAEREAKKRLKVAEFIEKIRNTEISDDDGE